MAAPSGSSRDRAKAALAPIAQRFGLSLTAAAHGVVEVANASMLRALRLVSVQRGYDLRGFALIAYGGAGPLHAGALARQAGMSRVVVPAHSGAFFRPRLSRLAASLRRGPDVSRARRRLGSEGGRGPLPRAQSISAWPRSRRRVHPLDRMLVTRSLDLRYAGQNYEITLPFGDGGVPALRVAFEQRHRQLYGYATGESIECVNLRVAAIGGDDWAAAPPRDAAPSRPAAAMTAGSHRAFFPETGEVTLPRHDRASLPFGVAIAGPAMIEDECSTIIVYPGQRAGAADRSGNLIIESAA